MVKEKCWGGGVSFPVSVGWDFSNDERSLVPSREDVKVCKTVAVEFPSSLLQNYSGEL